MQTQSAPRSPLAPGQKVQVRTAPRMPPERARMPQVKRSVVPDGGSSAPHENQAKVPIADTKFYKFPGCKFGRPCETHRVAGFRPGRQVAAAEITRPPE